jgi:hypothetical protein
MRYLLRDDASGFREMQGEPLDGQGGPLRPWAVTGDGRVVYAEWKHQGSGTQGMMELAFTRVQTKVAVRTYDKAVSLSRRREFETALALDASSHQGCMRPAIDRVTNGLVSYVGEANTDAAGGVIKRRCYNDTGSGRMGSAATGSGLSNGAAWQAALEVLRGNDIPKIIGIQSSIANVLTRDVRLGTGQQAIYNDTAIKVAPSQGYLYNWFSSDATRGRAKGAGATATSTPGVMNPGQVAGGDGESRKRGIDEWTQVKTSDFSKGIDMRNIAFGAGRSGTTGELLKTYRTFGSTDVDESFKQYLLAIVVYLVGGGHHSCHEIFSVANLVAGAGGPKTGTDFDSVSAVVRGAYVPGKYVKHLPASYLSTEHFGALKEKYYDIAMLGHLHATFVG